MLSVGYSDEDVESFDRQACIEKLADIVGRGLDQPLPTTTQQSTGYDVELERERLKWKQQKFEEEMRVKARELALKEQELFQAITRGQSNLTKSASRGGIPRLGVTPGGRKLYH